VVAFRTRHLFGLGAVSGTVAVTISAASFRTGNRRRDRDARGRFLHAGRYPDITFQAGTLSRAGDGWVPVTWRSAG